MGLAGVLRHDAADFLDALSFPGACLRLLARRLFGFDPGLLPSTAVAIALAALVMVVWFMGQVRHAAGDRSSDYMDAVGRGGRS